MPPLLVDTRRGARSCERSRNAEFGVGMPDARLELKMMKLYGLRDVSGRFRDLRIDDGADHVERDG